MTLFRKIKQKIMKRKVEKTAKSCGVHLKVNSKSFVNRKTEIGDYVNFNGMTIIGNGPVHIGSHFHSGQGCYIVTQNHDYDFGETIPYSATNSIEEPVYIDDNVWFGVGVIVLPGVTIGEGAIIQAGSVVLSDIPKCAIAGGHPAKVFKMRDISHYEELKEKGKFF